MTNDLISRTQAIDAMSESLKRVFPEHRQIAEKCLNVLPSAQQVRTQMSSADCISRRAAIDAVMDEFKRIPTSAIRAKTRIEALPSAQPEIIHCKDCKHYKAHEYTGKLACHYVIGGTVVRNLNDFCSRAERITNERSD